MADKLIKNMKRMGITPVPVPGTTNLFANQSNRKTERQVNKGTEKTLEVINKMLPEGPDVISSDFSFDMPIGPKHSRRFKAAGRERISPANRFVVEHGATPFFPGSGSESGMYDTNLRYDKTTGKWIQNYTFQEAPLVAGHEMSVRGVWDNVKVDDKDMYAIMLEDHTSQTQRFITRNNFEDIEEFFDSNLVPKGRENKQRINFVKADRSRRFYESIFDTNYYGNEQSIQRNLSTAYNVIDDYHDEIAKIRINGEMPITPTMQQKAIRNLTDKYNASADSDSQYLRSYDKIENTIGASERLLAERDIWEGTMKETSWITETSGPDKNKLKRQNLVFKNVKSTIEKEAGGAPKQDYGYTGMSRFRVPARSHKHEYTYFNVESKADFQVNLQSTLDTKNKGAGGVYLDTENLLKNIGNIDAKEKQEIMQLVRRDIKSQGQVDTHTLDVITNKLYKPIVEGDKNIVSYIPGTAIHGALNDGTSEIERYQNQLSSKVNPQFKRIIDGANRQAKDQLSNAHLFDEFNIDHLSDPARQKIKKTKDIVTTLDQTIMNSNKMYGFKQSGVKQTDPMDNIKNVIDSFKEGQVNFTLDYSENQDSMYLFFDSENRRSLDLTGMSFAEKLTDERLNQVVLPLQTEDFLVPVQGQNVQDKLVMRLPDGYRSGQNNPMELVRTGDVAFENLSNVPNRIEQILKWREEEGRPISRKEAADQAISEYSRRTTSGRPVGSHPGFFSPSGEGFKPGSAQKNLHGAATVDIGELAEQVFKTTEPDSYKRFEEWKEQVGLPHIRYVDSSFQDRTLRESLNDQRNRVMGRATSIFNQTYGEGTQYGIHGSSLGLNAKSYQEGNISLADVRSFTPLGQANPASREQITKQVNYMALDEGPVAEYLTSRYGFDSAQRMMSPTQSQNAAVVNQVSQEGLPGVLSRTYFTNEQEIDERVKSVLKDTQSELADIEAKLLTDKENIELVERKRLLKSDEKLLLSGRLSVFEEQTITSESFLQSLVSTENLTINLDEGYELDERLRTRIQSELSGPLGPGSYDLENPLTIQEMRSMGIVGDDDKITVGKLMKSEFLEEGSDFTHSQRERVYGGSTITGIEVLPDGKFQFNLQQVQRGEDGVKFIELFGGTRTTTMGIRDELYQNLFGSTDIVREHIKSSRYPAGQLFNILSETSYQNVMEDIDRLYHGGAAQTPAVQRWAENTAIDKLQTQDDFRRSFMSNEFMPSMEKTGLGMVELMEDGYSIIESSDLNIENLVGEKGFQGYQNLYNLASTDYGFDPKNAITQTSLHNVPWWQGPGTQPRYGGREFNIIAQSMRHANISPENSRIMSRYAELANDKTRSKHVKHARSVSKALDTFKEGATAEAFEKTGNVIVDMTGSFDPNPHAQSFRENMRVERLPDGGEYYIINGLDIPGPVKGMSIGSEVEGTASDFMSVPILSNDTSFDGLTIGDLVKENNSQAVLKIEDSRNLGPGGQRRFRQDVVPILPQFDEYSLSEQVIQVDTNKKLESVYNSVYAYHELDFSASSLTPEQQQERIAYYVRQADSNMKDARFSMNSYLGAKGPANFTEGFQSFRAESGMSNIVSMRNPLSDGVNWGANEVAYSRDHVESMILGNEKNILLANLPHSGMTEEQIKNLSGKALDAQRERIIERVTGPRDMDDDFRLIGTVSRNPIQSEGSILYSDIRIDDSFEISPNLDGGTRQASITSVQGVLMGADNDGDTFYTMLDLYSGDLSSEELQGIQSELTKMSGVYTKRIEETSVAKGGLEAMFADQPADTFQEVASLTDSSEINRLFGQFTGSGAEMGDIAIKSTQSPGIGLIDNQMTGARSTMNQVYRSAMTSGQIDTGSYNKIIDQWDRVNDNIVQNFISAKKMEVEDIFQEQLAGMGSDASFMGLDSQTQFDWITDYVSGRTRLPSQLGYMDTSNYEDIYRGFDELGILDGQIQIGEEMVDARSAAKESFGHLAAANEAIKGYKNPKFGIGTRKDAEGLILSIQENPQELIISPELINFSETLYGPESITHKNLVTVGSEQKEAIASKVMSHLDKNLVAINRGAGDTTSQFSDAMMDQLANATAMVEESNIGRKIDSGNQTFKALQNIGQGVVGSNAFKAGAGAAAVWALSAGIRRGPTPEGNEAEQEASAVEVNPSVLLTSPTARVTPNTENINLTISGRGNVDQNMLAGVVNREIEQMTNSQMQMSINMTDNTRKLDNRFYESRINRALGI